MVNEQKNYLLQVLSWNSRLIYLGLGLAAILFWTYLFGSSILEESIKGSDSGYALALISWINRWFPELPGWYPLQGAGTSSIVQYPYGAHYFVVLLSKASGLSLTEAFRVTQFASVAVTAWGIYLLAWRKLKSQTMALIAGLLYPISMATWTWVTAIGVFAQSSSLALFAPTFLFFDGYLLMESGHELKGSVRRRRLILSAAAVGFGMLMITHIIKAAVFALTIMLYSLLRAFLRPNGERLSSTVKYCKRSLVGLISGFALASFWCVPFLHINSFVNRDGPIAEFALHQIPYLDLLSVIGVAEPRSFYEVSFASPVLILAAIGFLLALRRERFVLSLAIICMAYALFTAMPGIWIGIVKPFERIWANLYGRALIPTMIFLPVVAGYGAVALPHRIASFSSLLMRRLTTSKDDLAQSPGHWSAINSGIASVMGIAIAVGAFVYLRHAPPGYGDYQGYGLPRGPDWWPFSFEGATVNISHWPSFELSDDDVPSAGKTASGLTAILDWNANTRLNLSHYFGSMLEILPLYSDLSTVGIYYYQGALNSPMKGYMSAAYWNSEYGSRHEVDEFARWIGVDYVALHRAQDPLEKYEGGNWEPIPLPDDKLFSNIAIRRFEQSPGIASIYMRPEILVIGGHENGVYEQIFRLFNSGLVTSQEATIVEGVHWIDDYSLEELAEFELIFLHGYGYRNRDRAWELLREYVESGGALYVETGWQYRVPEWQMEQAPPILPIENLTWNEVVPTESLALASGPSWLRGDVQEFAPMAWGDQPWGVSSPTGDLREWATPLLAALDKPLVAAGEYGNGKVVWSGMNLVGHIRSYENAEEREFLRSLMQWLLPQSESEWEVQPTVQREHPDRVDLRIPGAVVEGTYLIWRENHAPDWYATAKFGNHEEALPIYRAGPGMMIIHLPASPDEEMIVTLEYSLAGVRDLGRGITSLTAFLLLGAMVKPLRFPSRAKKKDKVSTEFKPSQKPEGERTHTFDIPSSERKVRAKESAAIPENNSFADSPQPNNLESSDHSADPWASNVPAHGTRENRIWIDAGELEKASIKPDDSDPVQEERAKKA